MINLSSVSLLFLRQRTFLPSFTFALLTQYSSRTHLLLEKTSLNDDKRKNKHWNSAHTEPRKRNIKESFSFIKSCHSYCLPYTLSYHCFPLFFCIPSYCFPFSCSKYFKFPVMLLALLSYVIDAHRNTSVSAVAQTRNNW